MQTQPTTSNNNSSTAKFCAFGRDLCGRPATYCVWAGPTLASALEQLDGYQLGTGPTTAVFLCADHVGAFVTADEWKDGPGASIVLRL